MATYILEMVESHVSQVTKCDHACDSSATGMLKSIQVILT